MKPKLIKYFCIVAVSALAAASTFAGADAFAWVGNSVLRIGKSVGAALSLFAGDLSSDYVDGTGTAARFALNTSIASDSSGNLYVADAGAGLIRKVTPAGVVTTLAGSPPGADGTGAGADLYTDAVAVDSSGNVYSTDWYAIRKITPAGVVTTFAGQYGLKGGADGTGSAARFDNPRGIAIDSSSNLYVADGDRIRKITPGAVVTTLAGSRRYSDGTGATARFSSPRGAATDSSGNIYIADSIDLVIRKVTPAGVVTTLAGEVGVAGTSDGNGTSAHFKVPIGIAVDSSGYVYVADAGNCDIRKISPAGNVTRLAGNPWTTCAVVDGSGTAAQFDDPYGVTVDSSGNVFVADVNKHVIRKITPTGVVTTFAGTAGVSGSSDGTGAAARFYYPYAISSDSSGNLYVAAGNYTVRKITASGDVTTLAGTPGTSGNVDGTGAAAKFSSLRSISVDSSGTVFVGDSGNHSLRAITPAGVVSTLAGGTLGYADGTGSSAQFNRLSGITADNSGHVFVSDSSNRNVRQVTYAGVVTTIAGVFPNPDGTGAAAAFSGLRGIAVDASNNVFVADAGDCLIRKVTSAGVVTTLAGSLGSCRYLDGTGAAANFDSLQGLATDTSGNVFVTDDTLLRKITPAGVVTTLAGTSRFSGPTDGPGASALFYSPQQLVVDGSGNIFIADNWNYSIRKVDTSNNVSTFAGLSSYQGSANGTGSNARFAGPTGIAIDGSGTLYVADSGQIRKISSSAVVTSFVGAPIDADGTGITARFDYPMGLAVDSSGNIFLVDPPKNTVRKITPAGVVTTIAGTAGKSGFVDGTGTAALFNYPRDVAADGSGNIFVLDSYNNAIRKITPGGVVSTFAGDGNPGGIDGTGGTAEFYYPYGMTIDNSGNLYVTDGQSTIRKVTPGGAVATLAGTYSVSGTADGTGASAQFSNNLHGITVDGSGNLYLIDQDNIRKITAGAVVTRVVGAPGVAQQLGFLPAGLGYASDVAYYGGKLFIVNSTEILTCPAP